MLSNPLTCYHAFPTIYIIHKEYIYKSQTGTKCVIDAFGFVIVFPGQILQVPMSPSKDQAVTITSSTNIIDSDGIRMGPGSAVLIQQRSLPSPANVNNTSKCDLYDVNDDEDGVQKFLKIKVVKQVTEMDGTVSGTLLITPNALMFDPDVTHPLVIENGHELYMVMAHMDDIMSVAVYKDIEALTQETADSTDIIYDPDHLRTPPPSQDGGASTTGLIESEAGGLPQIVEESGHKLSVADKEDLSDKDVDKSSAERRTDIYSCQHPSTIAQQYRSLSETETEVMKACESDQNECVFITDVNAYCLPEYCFAALQLFTNVAFAFVLYLQIQSLFKKLSLSARAQSIRGSVASSAGKVTQTAMSGTKSVAHGVVTHTKSAADTLQSGIETSAKMAAKGVDVMTSLPQGIVAVGSGLLEGLQTNADDMSQQHSVFNKIIDEVRNEASLRREQSLATLEALKQKTQLARESFLRGDSNLTTFACATSWSDMPELFKPVNEMISKPEASNNYSQQYITSQLPYYMIVKLNKKKRHSKCSFIVIWSRSSSNDNLNNTRLTRREFWFAIPRNKANAIYQFLLQWTPDKYGQEESKVTSSIAIPREEYCQSKEHDDAIELAYSLGHGNGFIVLDSDADEKLVATPDKRHDEGSSLRNRSNGSSEHGSVINENVDEVKQKREVERYTGSVDRYDEASHKSRKRSLHKSFKKLRQRAFSTPSSLKKLADISSGEKPPTPVFGKGSLNREWEIVTVEEMCRRLSLSCIDQMLMPIPDGASESQILDEDMIREVHYSFQIMQILPARAEGYPWVNIYNSEKHGFSLHTFYRKMMEWDEDMSPILLIIRDCQDHVFGGIASSAIRPSEHFFGTGDSSLLFKFVSNTHSDEKELKSFKWSGDNQYFVKANKDSLIMGAGRGHYGIWLDADLNYGRSQRCDTFKNEPLAGDFEDFNIQFIEAFGFKMV
ncbi:unnamed protein product [Anisakis simplex]|uniref:Oxidation resistance protein 1 n=1 Tax=Anisakis simplex TaxID=6269 RepID=A0A0M3K107_ANISI|nr:unnamed protein product [Anisakis simplex]